MALIFTASADSLSAERSSRYLVPFLKWLFPGISGEGLAGLALFVRKSAHVFEYAVLAMLVWFASRPLPEKDSAPRWHSWHAAVVLGIVVIYAATDELHQSTVPTRIGTPVDVLIDTLGGAIGLFTVWVFHKFLSRRLKKQTGDCRQPCVFRS